MYVSTFILQIEASRTIIMQFFHIKWSNPTTSVQGKLYGSHWTRSSATEIEKCSPGNNECSELKYAFPHFLSVNKNNWQGESRTFLRGVLDR